MGKPKLSKIVWLLLTLAGAAFAATAIWNLSAYQTKTNLEARHRANQRAELTRRTIDQTCRMAKPGGLVDCVSQEISSSREDQRAEYDLSAQNRTAQWALWSVILSGISTALTAIALWFVKGTLDATREAVSDTSKATSAMLAANAIAERVANQGELDRAARDRENVPALLVTDATYTDKGEHTGEFSLRIENVGRQAASDVYIISVERCFMPEGPWYEERMSISSAFNWLPNVDKNDKRRVGAVGTHPRTVSVPANFAASAMKNCAYITGTVVYSDSEQRDYVSQFFFWLPDDRFVQGVSVPMTSGSLRMATFKPYTGPELRDRPGY